VAEGAGDLMAGVRSRAMTLLRATPGVSRIGRLLLDVFVAERRQKKRMRREEKRLLRDRSDLVFQLGGGTGPDRYPHLFAALRDSLDPVDAPEILSFGCSTGEEIVSLKTYVPHGRFAGIDINRARVRQARRRIADPGVRLWAAGSIGEAGAGRFDAITCLSVLHRREALRDWPADCTRYITFAMFERAIADIDRHLKPGGVLLLFHTSFRFIETSVAPRYTPLLSVEPLKLEPAQRYDRNNRPVLEPRHERFGLWRKSSEPVPEPGRV
jgi:SAM-dependent methyltransferase